MKFITPYTTNRDRSFSFATINDEVSMTQEADARDTDINIIMERHGATGMAPQVMAGVKYGDFTNAGEFRDALDSVRDAQEMFNELPAKIRQQFGHDPAEFIDFATKPENLDAMIKMGLAPKKDVPDTPVAPVPPISVPAPTP